MTKVSADPLLHALQSDQRMGRQMLVVIGSGCSVSRGLPTMTRIFQWLHQRLDEMLEATKYQPAHNLIAIRSLKEDLLTMKSGGGSRAVAARALRLLQHAPLRLNLERNYVESQRLNGNTDTDTEICADLWHQFALAFLGGEIADSQDTPIPVLLQEPSDFHAFVGNLVARGRAIPLSLNFDGFTRKAIEKCFYRTAVGKSCVILSSPDALRGFFCASRTDRGPKNFVLKVWGDVFHAICLTPSCPQFHREVPLYDIAPPNILRHCGSLTSAHETRESLDLTSGQLLIESAGAPGNNKDSDDKRGILTKDLLLCPDCGQERQLQVFFAGYQEKEKRTEMLIPVLEKFIAPKVGSLFVAGFSGDWDSLLGHFLLNLACRISSEYPGHTKVFFVDKRESHICRLIKAAGVPIEHYVRTCDEFADTGNSVLGQYSIAEVSRKPSRSHVLERSAWEFWKPLLSKSQEGTYRVPDWCQDVPSKLLLNTLGRVRQLGIKTVLLRAEDWPHNRLSHSIGCATLAYRWQEQLEKNGNAPKISTYPPEITMLTAALHDMGHLPFSHLAEQALDELHWTLGPGGQFHHDNGSFRVAWSPIEIEARRLIKLAWENAPPADADDIIMRHIEGRSGVPHLDAILNSPIDVDKIDYVFRDCQMLRQAVHLPVGYRDEDGKELTGSRERCQWFETLIENQLVLPSGLLALYGLGGEKARELLEERWYLYRNVYFRPVFRGIERLARAILVLWLTRGLSKHQQPITGYLEQWFDSRIVAGEFARNQLWELLAGAIDPSSPDRGNPTEGGEAGMIEKMAAELCEETTLSTSAKDWVQACLSVLTGLRLYAPSGAELSPKCRSLDDLENELPRHATFSQPLFITAYDYANKIREEIRTLEYERPFVALIDTAAMPAMLSYPRPASNTRIAELYVVPDRDPDHWGRRPGGRWIPLSETVYGKWDKERWVQLLVISPYAGDYNGVGHIEDRLRTECRRLNVELRERMPQPDEGNSRANDN